MFADGGFAINGELFKVIKTSQFEVRLGKKSCDQILLIPNGSVITDVGKNHRMKNYAIMEKLQKYKISFPAYYAGKWSEENGCWIGELTVLNPNRSNGKIKK